MSNLFTIIVVCFITLSSCWKGSKKEMEGDLTSSKCDTIVLTKTEKIYVHSAKKDWQKHDGLTHDPNKDSLWGKSFSYYLDNPNCSGMAKNFYYGLYQPTDDFITTDLLNLALTKDSSLRPLYLWCLNKTILMADGALSEYIGAPARTFAERYPKEFFSLMERDTSGQWYQHWVKGISYSGFYEEYHVVEKKTTKEKIQHQIVRSMNNNCPNCSRTLIRKINIFAADITENFEEEEL